MLLTKIEATNFLTFDEIALDLTRSLNVLVGPNAAGKSNVVMLVDMLAKALAFAPTHNLNRFHELAATSIRFGEDTGELRVSVQFSDEHIDRLASSEVNLIKEFFLAFIASNVYSRLDDLRNNDKDRNADVAMDVGVSWVSNYLLNTLSIGTFILIVNHSLMHPIRIGYEFTYKDHAYVYSLTDHNVYRDRSAFRTGTERTSLIGLQPFQNAVTATEGAEPRIRLLFDDLLPQHSNERCAWRPDIAHLNRGDERWVTGLQRTFGERSNTEPIYSLAEVLAHLYTTKLVTTENLRRPPRRYYPISRLATGRPISDAEEVPLRLLQMKDHSILYYQEQFLAIQCHFNQLTGYKFGVAASYVAAGNNASPDGDTSVSEAQVVIDVFVLEGEGQARIDRAGSGIWEALFLATLLSQDPGVVTFLDEPAVNMHPTLQRKVLAELKASNQTIITTHSPYLVPSGTPQDLDTIIRLNRSRGTTRPCRMSSKADEKMSGFSQIHTQPDVRSMLFASGVLLVEGDTETGAFHIWFNHPNITDGNGTLDGNNFQMVSVGGDKSFGRFVTYLEAFGIPWAIICDGPVMSPSYTHSLTDQLPARAENDNKPDGDAGFEEWKEYWKSRGVFTVASEFGLRSTNEAASKCETCGRIIDSKKTKAGEIETFFKNMDPELWKCACSKNPDSKVRQGSYFAQHIEYNTPSAELETLKLIYSEVVKTLLQA